MSRSMDLIRLVVLKVCTDDPNGPIDGYGDDDITFHRQQAIEMRLLRGVVDYESDTRYPVLSLAVVTGVTSAGHDLIDTIRSDTNWNKVKEFLMATGKQVTLETVMHAVRELFRSGGS